VRLFVCLFVRLALFVLVGRRQRRATPGGRGNEVEAEAETALACPRSLLPIILLTSLRVFASLVLLLPCEGNLKQVESYNAKISL